MNFRNSLLPAALSAPAALSFPSRGGKVEVDPEIPGYKQVSGVTGNLNSTGSDTLSNLMTLRAEEFKAYYPKVNIRLEGKGSSTAPPALIEGAAQPGPVSRAMQPSEIDEFAKTAASRPKSTSPWTR